MIYSASTLFLATLVFNAAAVLGAPVRIPPVSQPIARVAVDKAPVLPRETVDVPSLQRSVDDVPIDSRSVANAAMASENAIRDTAPAHDTVEARDPLPEVEAITRRFPRRVHHDFYQKRSQPSPPLEARAPSPEPDSGPVERRYPRRALFQRHEVRSEPASPPEARSVPAVEPPVERRFPRRVYAEHYEKRSTTPSPEVEARQEAATPVERRFPRAVYAEHYKRADTSGADAAAGGTTTGDKPAETPAAEAAKATATEAPAAAEAAKATATNARAAAAASATPAASANATAPPAIVQAILNGTSPAIDWNKIVADITEGNKQGFQPGTTIKETTLLVNKVIHVSEPAKDSPAAAAACSPASSCTGSTPVSSSSTASTPTGTTTTATGTTGNVGEGAPTASPSASAASTADGTTATTDTTTKEERDIPGSENTESRRSLGSDQASPGPILRRRDLGYSGPALASYAKRSAN